MSQLKTSSKCGKCGKKLHMGEIDMFSINKLTVCTKCYLKAEKAGFKGVA
jgi:hypothetical protein